MKHILTLLLCLLPCLAVGPRGGQTSQTRAHAYGYVVLALKEGKSEFPVHRLL